MNRRLKELAADAGYPDYMTYGQDKVLEKFAELIVRECAMACEKNSYLALNGWQRAKQIKEHFGVEE